MPASVAPSKLSIRRKHLTVAAVIALFAAVILVGLAAFAGAPRSVLWVIGIHQLIANVVLLGWLSIVAEEEDESS